MCEIDHRLGKHIFWKAQYGKIKFLNMFPRLINLLTAVGLNVGTGKNYANKQYILICIGYILAT